MKIAFVFLLLALATARSNAQTSIPKIAESCGVRFGYDTMETLERQMGKGLPQVGGHARGGRLWQSPAADCDIYADAFHYNDHKGRAYGRVLDFLSITPASHDPEIPTARLPRKQALFMGVVSLGMTKAEVLHAVKSKLPPPKVRGSGLIWDATGFVRVNRGNNVTTRSWRAELRFEEGMLHEIRIEASTGYP